MKINERWNCTDEPGVLVPAPSYISDMRARALVICLGGRQVYEQ